MNENWLGRENIYKRRVLNVKLNLRVFSRRVYIPFRYFFLLSVDRRKKGKVDPLIIRTPKYVLVERLGEERKTSYLHYTQ